MKRYLILFLLILSFIPAGNTTPHGSMNMSLSMSVGSATWATPTDIPASEAAALLDFYTATDGNNWTNGAQGSGADAWGDTATANDWYGITVTAGHVVAIELPNNALSGDASGTLSPCPIETLDLGQNPNMNPPDLSSCTALTTIDLEDCAFTAADIELVFGYVDTAGASNGTISIGGSDATNYNKSPNTTIANSYVSSLEVKSWTVNKNEYRDIIGYNANLLNYWPMDEAAGLTLAASAGGVNLTLDGATVNQTGKVDGTSVLFDGVNDYGYSAASIDLSSHNKLYIEMLVNYTAKAESILAEFHTNSLSVEDGFLLTIEDENPYSAYSVTLIKNDNGICYKRYPRPSAGEWHHIVGMFDKSATGSEEVHFYVDGVEISESTNPLSVDGTNNFGDRVLYIASRAGASFFTNAYIQHLAIYSSLSSADIEEHVESAGIFPVYKVKTEDVWFNGWDNVDDMVQSSYSKFIFDTYATSVTISGYNNIFPIYPDYAHLGLWINGVEQTALSFSAGGQEGFVLNLGGAGSSKRVEISTCLSRWCTATIHHTLICGITSITGGTVSVVTPNNSVEMVIYGDSIHSGAFATGAEYDSLVPLLRETYGFDVACEGISCRELYDDANTEALRTNFVTRISGYAPTKIWMAIGTNDYGIESWGASDFGTGYSVTLDDLHAALPNATIYCQTPLLRDDETANSFGDTLGDYRAQIVTACSTRSSWAILVDGTEILTTGDLADGVHPTTAGHAKYALYINNYFNE